MWILNNAGGHLLQKSPGYVSKSKRQYLCVFTYLHDPSKNRRVVHCAAVPAPMSELVLALSDACLGTFTDVLHVVLVELAQLLLALRQPHQLAAQRLGTDDVGLRDQYRVHGQRPG